MFATAPSSLEKHTSVATGFDPSSKRGRKKRMLWTCRCFSWRSNDSYVNNHFILQVPTLSFHKLVSPLLPFSLVQASARSSKPHYSVLKYQSYKHLSQSCVGTSSFSSDILKPPSWYQIQILANIVNDRCILSLMWKKCSFFASSSVVR